MTIVFKFNEHIVDAILKEKPSHFEDKNTSGRASQEKDLYGFLLPDHRAENARVSHSRNHNYV
jgi:hypothetical protein